MPSLIDGLDGWQEGISYCSHHHGGRSPGGRTGSGSNMRFYPGSRDRGFLPYNFIRPKPLWGMENQFSELCLAGIISWERLKRCFNIPFIPIVILGIPVRCLLPYCAGFTNEPIFKPDKDHLHHRLMAMGMSHRRSVFTIYLISAFLVG